MKKYDLILADPPWQYSNKVSNGAANNHYQTTSLFDLKHLPVHTIAAENSALAMWYTGNFVQEAFELAKAWGFKVKTMLGFVWVKLNKLAMERITKQIQNGELFDAYDYMDILNNETKINGGNYTRANTEICLIAVRGNGLPRQSASVRQVIYSCLGDHSEKPKEVHHRLEELYGNVPRIELFAREKFGDWDVFGDQVESNIQFNNILKIA
ncbi:MULTISPECIES: MT-A70 family methyltransferase [Providencia]|uniref:MT-A70 family methyltransferase n=1 Tax=Providencia TaxID=586 RepID=UPI0018E7CAC3|nr:MULTISPECIES: MT-A70 family methyltransferase [Providencia]QQE94413.1 DNA methyltransferase [Providencia rettgeri]QWJ92878.1 DNA methyltransferase [Providencia rettgeri]WOC05424.1 MT-A70 family methyltransferase [Providencia sp. PROV024]